MATRHGNALRGVGFEPARVPLVLGLLQLVASNLSPLGLAGFDDVFLTPSADAAMGAGDAFEVELRFDRTARTTRAALTETRDRRSGTSSAPGVLARRHTAKLVSGHVPGCFASGGGRGLALTFGVGEGREDRVGADAVRHRMVEPEEDRRASARPVDFDQLPERARAIEGPLVDRADPPEQRARVVFSRVFVRERVAAGRAQTLATTMGPGGRVADSETVRSGVAAVPSERLRRHVGPAR